MNAFRIPSTPSIEKMLAIVVGVLFCNVVVAYSKYRAVIGVFPLTRYAL